MFLQDPFGALTYTPTQVNVDGKPVLNSIFTTTDNIIIHITTKRHTCVHICQHQMILILEKAHLRIMSQFYIVRKFLLIVKTFFQHSEFPVHINILNFYLNRH